MRNKQEKPTLCLGDGFRLSHHPGGKGSLGRQVEEQIPPQPANPGEGEVGREIPLAKYPMGMNPWLTPALVRAGTRFRCPKRVSWGPRGRGGTFPAVIQEC